MSDSWKLNKWIEDITPRRAIQNFFHHATPVDSPDPEELVQIAPQSSTDFQEATPVAGSSHSSQRSNALKRKLASQETQENASKRNLIEESYLITEDSVSGISEVPSQLASPSVVIPPRPNVRVNKRISMTAFTQAIQSQPSQASKHSETTGFMDESSIPSALGSPDEALSQRPRKGMSRVSMSAFAETLGRKQQEKFSQASSTAADSSELESSGIPSNLESPDYVTSQRPGVDKTRRRVSSSGFKKIFEKSQQPQKEKTISEDSSLDSLGIPDTLASSVFMPSQELAELRKSKRVSSTAFNEILNRKSIQNRTTKDSTTDSISTSEDLPLSLGSPEVESVEHRFAKNKSRMSTTAFKNVLEEHKKKEDQIMPTERNSRLEKSSGSVLKASDISEGNLRDAEMTSDKNVSSLVTSKLSRSSARTPTRTSTISETLNPISTQTVEETKLDDREIQLQPLPLLEDNNELDQYLSLSDSDDRDAHINADIVEFTVNVGPEPATETNRSPSILDDEKTPKKSVRRVEPEVQRMSVLTEGARSFNEKLSSTDKIQKTFDKTQTRASYLNQSEVIGNIPDLESPEGFSPIASSTQLMRRPPSVMDDTDIEEIVEPVTAKSVTKQSIVSNDSVSTSEIPSKLESPQEYKERQRPGPASSKKRISMTGFLAVLNEKSIRPSSPETPRQTTAIPDLEVIVPTTSAGSPILEEPTNKSSVDGKEKSSHTVHTTPVSSPIFEGRKNESLRNVKEKMGHTLPAASIDSPIFEGRKSVTVIEEKEKTVRSSSRASTSPASTSSSVTVPRSEIDDRASQQSEPPSDNEVFLASPAKISSPIMIPVDEKDTSSDEIETASQSSSSRNRSRKSLKFDSPNAKRVSQVPPASVIEPQPVDDDDEVEETPPSDYESSDEEVVMEEGNASVTPEQTARLSNEPNSSVRSKSNKSRMSSTNRYPALKNSTVVAGGAPFSGGPLSMSPITSEKDAPLQIQSTPPTTPAQPSRKQGRSVSQSPMFLNVMQKALQKTTQEMKAAGTPTVRRSSVAKKSTTPKSLSVSKGISLNPSKGKSLLMPALDEMPESSETEWEDVEEDAKVKPLPIKIAFEQIEDRSKQFVPVEQRLRADPVFQAKVKNQRAKLEAQKAAEKAAEATKKKETQRKPRSTQAANKDADNVANVMTNKGNFRFYARTKITKEALDAVHNLVGEWFDFTIDQMETFCNDEGKVALETWEDCMRLLKRQGIIKNYWEYSGLCHELLLNDECSGLLPSDFPAGHYESKREAKRQNK